jgi:hypothetical protein
MSSSSSAFTHLLLHHIQDILDDVLEMNRRGLVLWKERSFGPAVSIMSCATEALGEVFKSPLLPTVSHLQVPIPKLEPIPMMSTAAAECEACTEDVSSKNVPLPCYGFAFHLVRSRPRGPCCGIQQVPIASTPVVTGGCSVGATELPKPETCTLGQLISEYTNIVLFNLALIHHQAAMDPAWAAPLPLLTPLELETAASYYRNRALELYDLIGQSFSFVAAVEAHPVLFFQQSEITTFVQLAVLNNIAHIRWQENNTCLMNDCLLLFDFLYDHHSTELNNDTRWKTFAGAALFVLRQAGYASAAA